MKILGGDKIQHVLCTGNLGNKETFDWLKSVSPNFHCVRAQYDDENSEIHSDHIIILIGILKILLIYGHQFIPWNDEETINVFLKENNCDIAVFGNSYQSLISKFEKKYLLYPGSLTGVYGALKQYFYQKQQGMLLFLQSSLFQNVQVMKWMFINKNQLVENSQLKIVQYQNDFLIINLYLQLQLFIQRNSS